MPLATDNSLSIFASAAVNTDVPMTLYMRSPEDECVSIVFGDERFALEFFDVESLERLRNLAEEGARRLRTAVDNSQTCG